MEGPRGDAFDPERAQAAAHLPAAFAVKVTAMTRPASKRRCPRRGRELLKVLGRHRRDFKTAVTFGNDQALRRQAIENFA